MVELAQERDDQALRLAALTAQCILRATQTPLYDLSQARALAEEALLLAGQLIDRAAEARVLWRLLLIEVWGGGDSRQALAYGERSLAICRELGLKEQMGYTLTNLVNVYWTLDQFEETRQANLGAQAVWLETGNTPMLANSYMMNLSVNQFAGNYPAALKAAAEALRLSQSIGNMWNQTTAKQNIGVIHLDQGELGQAEAGLRQALALAEQAGITAFKYSIYRHQIMLYLIVGAIEQAGRLADQIYRDRGQLVYFFYSILIGHVAQVRVAQGDLPLAQQIVTEAYQGREASDLPLIMVAPVLVADSMLQLAQGEPRPALVRAQQLVERSRQAGTHHFLPEALLVEGQALVALGEYLEAGEALREGATVAEEIGQRRVWWQILAAMAQLEQQRGDHAAFNEIRGEARPVINFIANHIGHSDLRQSFLAQAGVQALLSS